MRTGGGGGAARFTWVPQLTQKFALSFNWVPHVTQNIFAPYSLL